MAYGSVNVPGKPYKDLESRIAKAEQTIQGGVATLDSTGRVPETQLPSLCPFVVGTSTPSDTKKLWIDTTANTGGLKYWNGSAWATVPVAYT